MLKFYSNIMLVKIKPYLLIAIVTFASAFILWLPFLIKTSNWLGIFIPNSNFEYILKNYDGPHYVVVSKTFYNPKAIVDLKLELQNNPSYYASHLPFYPFFIRLFSIVFGFLKSMIIVNLFFTIALSWLFYYFVKKNKLAANCLAGRNNFLLLSILSNRTKF